MSRVLATGPRIPVSVTIAAAAFLHVGMAAGATAASLYDEIFAWQRGIRDIVAYRLSAYEMQIEHEPPPPPKEEPKEEPPEEAKPLPKDSTPPPAPPPAPAQAAKILTSDPDPSAPVDLTNSFVTGSGNTYAGGETSQAGTSKTAVYNPLAANTGVPGGTGTAPAPAPRKDDRTRGAGLLGSTDWNDCPFPGEADADQIDRASVMIQVKVKPDGSPESVQVVQDPGHGFGREAKKCAMRKRYTEALDADGKAIGGTTKPFRVQFLR
jgi:protein TonB